MSWISKKIPAPAVVPGWWQDARRLSTTTIQFSFESRSTGQVAVSVTSFTSYTDSCASGFQSYALYLNSIQPTSDYDMPLLSNLFFDSDEVNAFHISDTFEDKIVLAEDRSGTMNPSGSQGFLVNNAAHM